MTGLNAGHVGIAGEVRCIVRHEDGTVKEDTGFQKNLILNQGLDFFGGGKGSSMFNRCAIGSGNATPVVTQTALSSFLATAAGVESSVKYDYVPDASNLYKVNKVCKYSFTGLNNVNVSEVGLVSLGSTSADYYLCTRALLKDSSGSPVTITVLSGEILEVYYKLWKVVSVLDTSYTVNMLDAKGGVIPYNCVVRAANIGNIVHAKYLGEILYTDKRTSFEASSSELTAITAAPTGVSPTNAVGVAYTQGSYKRQINIYFDTTTANLNIRSIVAAAINSQTLSLLSFQSRFGSVAEDSPIPKTSLQTLLMPFEFSWGRYEGAL